MASNASNANNTSDTHRMNNGNHVHHETRHARAVDYVRQATTLLSDLLRLMAAGGLNLSESEAIRVRHELDILSLQVAAAEARVRERLEAPPPDSQGTR